ncbi:MAG TPA: hypothetical protein VGN35_03955 [Jatrophihabitantaceae bacterium]|nr:hypothetical protein [Jatrophihabitantaceae bacterium]
MDNSFRSHPSRYRNRTQTVAPQDIEPPTIIAGQSADCCLAAPMFRAVLPPTQSRTGTAEVFLCGHHRRASEISLWASGAAIFDAAGRLVASASA